MSEKVQTPAEALRELRTMLDRPAWIRDTKAFQARQIIDKALATHEEFKKTHEWVLTKRLSKVCSVVAGGECPNKEMPSEGCYHWPSDDETTPSKECEACWEAFLKGLENPDVEKREPFKLEEFLTKEQWNDIDAELILDRKAQAVMMFRNFKHVGLAEAKKAVDMRQAYLKI